jgi:hypothetical protein
VITYYIDKQGALSADEFDANFRDLDDRLRAFQALGIQATGIASLTVDESVGTLVFALTDGTAYGPFNLPVGFFVPRGNWQSGLAYRLRDYATVGGSSYACLAPHTAGASFADDLAAGRWMTIAAKGPAGKDGDPFMLFRGLYDPTIAYVAGDAVLALSGTAYVLYRLAVTAPAGTAPGTLQPGSPAPYWTLQSLPLATTEHDGYIAGTFAAAQLLYRRRLARAQSIGAALLGSVAALATAPAKAFTIGVFKNGTQFATLSWAVGALNPTLAGAATTFAAGDVLTVVAPATADTAAAGLDLSILATLS